MNVSNGATAGEFDAYISAAWPAANVTALRALYPPRVTPPPAGQSTDGSNESAATTAEATGSAALGSAAASPPPPTPAAPPPSPWSPFFWSAERMETDFTFGCCARRASRWLTARAGGAGGTGGGGLSGLSGRIATAAAPVYRYLFAHHAGGQAADADTLVVHGDELPYLWCGGCAVDAWAAGAQVSAAMIAYWANFAKCSDPNGCRRVASAAGGAGAWEPLPDKAPESPLASGTRGLGGGALPLPFWASSGTNTTESVLLIGSADGAANITLVPALHAHQCDFWDLEWEHSDKCTLVPPAASSLLP